MDQFTMLSSFDDPIYIFILQSFSKDLGTFKWKALITFELLFPQNTSVFIHLFKTHLFKTHFGTPYGHYIDKQVRKCRLTSFI